jgi:hypothetical protein
VKNLTKVIFSIDNTIKLCYWFGGLKIKPITVQEIEHYNILLSLDLLRYDQQFNYFDLTQKGLEYFHKIDN